MALYFDAGVSQTAPSTPGVLLPLFPVTRSTAKALPLNEWVRSRCRIFTLPQRPSRVAFTIRACSRLTWRSCRDHLSWSHAMAASEGAHGDCSPFICDSLLRQFCPLSRNALPAGSLPACAVE